MCVCEVGMLFFYTVTFDTSCKEMGGEMTVLEFGSLRGEIL